jgi:hypothetical protein
MSVLLSVDGSASLEGSLSSIGERGRIFSPDEPQQKFPVGLPTKEGEPYGRLAGCFLTKRGYMSSVWEEMER